MSDKISRGLKANMRFAVRQAGIYPYLFALAALTLAGLLYFCMNYFALSSALWLSIFSVLAFLAIIYVVFPLFYGVSLLTADAVRLKGKEKLSLAKAFRLYYRGNRNVFFVFQTFLKAILFSIAAGLIVFGVLSVIMMRFYPNIYNELLNYFSGVYPADTTLQTIFGADERTYEIFSIAADSLLTVSVIGFIGYEIRSNENVFYLASALITDSRINVVTGSLIPLFRKKIMPTVRKERFRYNLSINWPGYAVYAAVFGGIVLVGFLVPGFSFGLVAYTALLAALAAYAPFYYYARVFDDLFGIAYSDKIMARLPPPIRQIVEEGRRTMAPHVTGSDSQAAGSDDGSDDSSGGGDSGK